VPSKQQASTTNQKTAEETMMLEKDLSKMERVHFFSGQLLTADDLNIEQQYFREKLKRHNRHLHGSGVVFGLEVSIEDHKVRISPGFALDCTGEEINVPEAVRIDPPQGQRFAFLMIAYKELETGFIPVPGESDLAEDKMQPTRIEEHYELLFEPDDPYIGHVGDTALWMPCSRPHALPLAKLVHRWENWEVDPWFEPPSIAR
jgi:hypothetical protein